MKEAIPHQGEIEYKPLPAAEAEYKRDLWEITRAIAKVDYVDIEAQHAYGDPKEMISLTLNTKNVQFASDAVLTDVIAVISPIYQHVRQFVISVTDCPTHLDFKFVAVKPDNTFVSGLIRIRSAALL